MHGDQVNQGFILIGGLRGILLAIQYYRAHESYTAIQLSSIYCIAMTSWSHLPNRFFFFYIKEEKAVWLATLMTFVFSITILYLFLLLPAY